MLMQQNCESRERLGRLKVLVFSPDPALGGGVAEFAAVLKRKLSPELEVDWFRVGRRSGSLAQLFGALIPLIDALSLALRLMTIRHDVYHLNPSFVPRSLLRDGLFLLVLRLFRRKNILVFFRGWDTKYFTKIASSPLRAFVFKYVYGEPSRILVLASTFARDLKALGFDPEKIHTLTTMFDGDLFKDAVRLRNDESFRILFLARFVAEKGMYELLEAFRRISLTDPQVLLVMAGDGHEIRRAQQWCVRYNLQRRVLFPGYVKDVDKANLLINSDIFVLPSYREGCPNSLLEAMGAGLPVIVTPVGGIPDIVSDQINGFLVPVRSPDAIELGLRKLMAHSKIRNAMSDTNRAQAWERYEASAVTARLEAHYRLIADRGSGSA